ncbi:MAG: class II aldolase/adducin family protein [Oligoflexia bacterium]|nr:class II aldolase/adducin family protein [Oligoflexia bacterium]
MNVKEIKAEIAKCCQRMWQRGYVANHDGNISYKISPNLYIATPTSFSKADVTEDSLILIDEKANVVEGKYKVFSEISWHFAIYQARADVSCVVHGHPPVATGIGLSGSEIGTPALAEAVVSLGRAINTLKFFSPLELTHKHDDLNFNSAINLEFKNEVTRVLTDCDSFLASGNGVWTVGQEVTQTYLRLELVEQIAQASLHAKAFGGVKALSSELVEALLKKRPKTLVKSVNAIEDGSGDYLAVRKIVESEVAKIIQGLK